MNIRSSSIDWGASLRGVAEVLCGRGELLARGLSFELIEAASAAEALARVSSLPPEQPVLAVGGDGTVSALLPALVGTERPLALLPLGAGVSQGLGLRLAPARLALILLAGLGTGAATVLVGPLSFVGLMAPHMARRMGLARPGDHVTGAALTGAGLMLAADFGARMAGFPYELPLGLFATLLGAPWLLFLLMRTTR